MFTTPFGYRRASSLEEAVEALRASDGEAKVIAGGQSLLPMVNLGLVHLEAVVDIANIDEARDVTVRDGYLHIGALIRHAELERDATVAAEQPLLMAAAQRIGSPRIRGRGTLGGSLAHSDPAAELPLAMITLGATYHLIGGDEASGGSAAGVGDEPGVGAADAMTSLPAHEFHQGYFATALDDTQLVAAVQVPTLGPDWGWGFQEVSRRRGDFAIVAAAALVRLAEGRIVESRLALAGVGDRPLRVSAVEASVMGATAGELPDRIGPIAGIEPTSDTNASADHRRHLARVLSVRALAEACRRARTDSPPEEVA